MLNKNKPPVHRGSAHHAARFVEATVAHIKGRLASGEQGKVLAREFETTSATISRMKTGKLWRHVQAAVVVAVLLVTAIASADAPAKHTAWVHAALVRLPVARGDREPERLEIRKQNLSAFAVEIARVSASAPLPARQWAALLATIGASESNFDTEITAGRCKAFQCDPHLVKGVRVHKAVGVFQQQLVSYVADLWPTAAGDIPAQVTMADRSLRRSLTRCRSFASFPAHVFRAYGGIASCSFELKDEQRRVALYLKLLSTPNPVEAGS